MFTALEHIKNFKDFLSTIGRLVVNVRIPLTLFRLEFSSFQFGCCERSFALPPPRDVTFSGVSDDVVNGFRRLALLRRSFARAHVASALVPGIAAVAARYIGAVAVRQLTTFDENPGRGRYG